MNIKVVVFVCFFIFLAIVGYLSGILAYVMFLFLYMANYFYEKVILLFTIFISSLSIPLALSLCGTCKKWY